MTEDGIVPLGGYFEMELPSLNELPFANQRSYYYQSARAAFRALLQKVRPVRLWMPSYICDAMISAVESLGISIEFYSQSDLLKFDIPELIPGDVLLLVNYFGLHDRNIDDILKGLNNNQVVIDNSQALFSTPRDCLANLFSPRKFLGVPDGGIVVTNCALECSDSLSQSDNESLSRSGYLLKRLALGPEAGYSDYQAAENSLTETTPKPMSNLTRALLRSIDRKVVSDRRRENYLFLSDSIDKINLRPIRLQRCAVPLCYPLTVNNRNIRPALIEKKIFLPIYWNDVCHRVSPGSAEAHFVEQILPIPIDQRYSPRDLKRIVDILISFF